jgi:hypothetical protein
MAKKFFECPSCGYCFTWDDTCHTILDGLTVVCGMPSCPKCGREFPRLKKHLLKDGDLNG